MYILGFLLIFIGLSLLLYTLVIYITNHPKTKKEGELFTESKDSTEVPLKEIHKNFVAQQTQNSSEIQEKKTELPREKQITTLEKPKKTSKQIELELFITGYLYFDSTGKTFILIEKKEKAPSEVLSHLVRLGNAALEWFENKFVISYAETHINLPIKELQEVRFVEECAIFIPKEKNAYYYFFSKQIHELKELMSKLSEIYKSSV